jgi:hypothetical protein
MVNPARRPPGTYCALGGSERRSHLAWERPASASVRRQTGRARVLSGV